MKSFLLFINLFPIFLFSQEWNDRVNSQPGFKGISVGFLLEGQSKYPTPYYGPEVNGLFNDGTYHFAIDIYYSRFLIGFQLSDEFLYLEKFQEGFVWKPRGFNQSYSSLTRSCWFTLGYNMIHNLNIKIGMGFRNGPIAALTNKKYTPLEVASGFNYSNPESIFNTSQTLDDFSELDYSVSINYPIKLYGKFGLVPELGYTIQHGGILTGISIIY